MTTQESDGDIPATATDPRVEKIAAIGFLPDWAARSIKAFEAAGLLVLADNEDGRASMRRTLEHAFWPFLAHDPAKPDLFWGQAVDSVYRALRSSPPAGFPAAGGALPKTHDGIRRDKAIRPRG